MISKLSGINYPIVTLCGSTKFKEDFFQMQRVFTEQGYIVLMPEIFGHSGDSIDFETKLMLDDMHKAKIEIADSIYIINKNGYIGKSTASEIEYAKKLNKSIIYMESINETL